jgi:Trypsin
LETIKKTTIVTVLSILAISAVFGSTALAITGKSQPNLTPYTGVVVLFSDPARTTPIGYCSGVLISPTVMLTAGHATLEAASVSVCFDKGPIDYSIKDGKLIYPNNEIIFTGTPIAYPEYALSVLEGTNNGNHLFSSSDIGIIILDTPVKAVTAFPSLPPAGLADTLNAKTSLQEVGYGLQLQVTPKNNGVVNSWAGTLSCNSATAQLVPGNFAGSDKYLKLTANPSQDKGGIAFGDSGGPVLYSINGEKTLVIAVNAYVANSNCAGVTYHTRVDNPQVLAWINGFL